MLHPRHRIVGGSFVDSDDDGAVEITASEGDAAAGEDDTAGEDVG